MSTHVLKSDEDLTDTELDVLIGIVKDKIKNLEEGNWWFLICWYLNHCPDLAQRLKNLESIKANRVLISK